MRYDLLSHLLNQRSQASLHYMLPPVHFTPSQATCIIDSLHNRLVLVLPTSMTLDELGIWFPTAGKFEFSRNIAWFRRFWRQQQPNEWRIGRDLLPRTELQPNCRLYGLLRSTTFLASQVKSSQV